MERTTLHDVTKATREIEVLKYKLKIDANNYEAVAAATNEKIESLKDENDSLRETVGEKDDKIYELKRVIGVQDSKLKDKENEVQTLKVQDEENKKLLSKQDDQINTLKTELEEMGLELQKKKEEIQNLKIQQNELSDMISKLEQENKNMHRESINRQQQMRDEISRLNKELQKVTQCLRSKDNYVKKLQNAFHQFAAKQEQIQMENKIKEQERQKREQEKEQRDREDRNQIQRCLEEVMKQINSPKTKIAITDAQNVQVGHACTNQQKNVAIKDLNFSKPGGQKENQRPKRPR